MWTVKCINDRFFHSKVRVDSVKIKAHRIYLFGNIRNIQRTKSTLKQETVNVDWNVIVCVKDNKKNYYLILARQKMKEVKIWLTLYYKTAHDCYTHFSQHVWWTMKCINDRFFITRLGLIQVTNRLYLKLYRQWKNEFSFWFIVDVVIRLYSQSLACFCVVINTHGFLHFLIILISTHQRVDVTWKWCLC